MGRFRRDLRSREKRFPRPAAMSLRQLFPLVVVGLLDFVCPAAEGSGYLIRHGPSEHVLVNEEPCREHNRREGERKTLAGISFGDSNRKPSAPSPAYPRLQAAYRCVSVSARRAIDQR